MHSWRETSRDTSPNTCVGAYLIPAPGFPLSPAAFARRAHARAHLDTPTIFAAMADVSRMPWELIDTGTDDLPFRIEPGSTLSRFISGKRIRFYEDHARHLLAQALAGRVGRIHRQILNHMTRCRTAFEGRSDFENKTPLEYLRSFACDDVRRVFERSGIPGLIELADGPNAGVPVFGSGLCGCGLHDDAARSALAGGKIGEDDRLVPMFAGYPVPSKATLIKQVAYVRGLGWSVKRGTKFPWVIKESHSFTRQRLGTGDFTEAGIARTMVARAIYRMVPASCAAINGRMTSVDDVFGARAVKVDICDDLARTLGQYGYSGMLAVSGTGRVGITQNFFGD